MEKCFERKTTYRVDAATKRLDSRSPEVAIKMKTLSAQLMKRNQKLYESLATK